MLLPKREWKKVKNYEGKYWVSNNGKIKNKNKRLKLSKNKQGYLMVHLCKNNKCKWFRVHRLVAEAFIPNPNNYSEVNHKDENKENNHLNNLEWCNRKYNMNYGTIKDRMVTNKEKVICIETGIVYESITDAARKMNVHRSNISACVRGKHKTSCGYHWKYFEQ